MPRALARLEARDAAAESDPAAILRAVADDLRLLGHLSRDTIRRVRAATGSAVQPPSGFGSSTADKAPGPASVGSGRGNMEHHHD